MQTIERELRYEADRDPAFADEIRRMPGCERIDHCIQCATCSGICPVSDFMDQTPRRIIELTRNGFKDDVLNSNTIWLCTSCYQCQVECPKGIGITDVMYALKTKAIASGRYPSRFIPPTLFQEFVGMVRRSGRLSESRLAQLLFLKTQPTRFWGMKKLGLRLMKTGRFSMRTERMERPDSIRKVMAEAGSIDGRETQ